MTRPPQILPPAGRRRGPWRTAFRHPLPFLLLLATATGGTGQTGQTAIATAVEPLYALQQIRVTAGGHPIRETPGGILMEQGFGPSCRIVPTLGEALETSLAGTVAESVELEIRAMSCRPAPTPSIRCQWWIVESDGRTLLRQGQGATEDWHLRLPLALPDTTGEALLRLGCQVGTRHQVMERALFVTYRAPTPLVTVLQPPPETWYRRAVQWGGGFRHDATEGEVLAQMLQALYDFGEAHWRYGSFPSPRTRRSQYCFDSGFCFCNWQFLVQRGQPCDFANCYQFCDAWEGITATLGIGGYDYIISEGSAGGGLVTKTAFRSFDHAFVSNAICTGDDLCPAYVFSSHNLRGRDGLLYDPTFGQIYRHLAAPIALDLETHGERHCRPAVGYPRLKVCPLGIGYDSWNQWGIADLRPPISSSAPSLSPTVSFAFSEANGLRLHEALIANLTVDRPTPGRRLLVNGTLSKGDRIIADSTAWTTPAFSSAVVVGEGASAQIRLRFSGEQIFRARQDGPWTLRATLLNGEGEIDSLERLTPSFLWEEFGEVQATLDGVETRLLRQGPDRRDGLLFVKVRLQVREAGIVVLQGRLADRGRTLTYLGDFVDAHSGEMVVTLRQRLDPATLASLTAPPRLTLEIYDSLLQALDSTTVPVQMPDPRAPRVPPR